MEQIKKVSEKFKITLLNSQGNGNANQPEFTTGKIEEEKRKHLGWIQLKKIRDEQKSIIGESFNRLNY